MLQSVTWMTHMTEFTPLLTPGIHTCSEADLAAIAVTAYPSSVRRSLLFGGLQAWLAELRANGCTGRCWLDGSFLTEKQEPDDIDLVIILDGNLSVPVTPVVQAAIGRLLDKALVRAQYGLDVYMVDARDPQAVVMTSYWRGWYGFCRDGITAKGIAEVLV